MEIKKYGKKEICKERFMGKCKEGNKNVSKKSLKVYYY